MKPAIIAAVLALAASPAIASDPAGEMSKPSRQVPGEILVRSSGIVPAPEDLVGHPLGSPGNPVRAYLPSGQMAYLGRLICPKGERPKARRLGAGEAGPYGNVTDIYELTCRMDEAVTIVMDMYHPSTIETEPVPGFTIRGFQN